MVRRQKMKAKEEREEQEAQKDVIFVSSSDDDEANEDLSLEIVERSRMREAKRKRAEDFDEFKGSGGARLTTVVDISSTSSDETEIRRSGGGGVVAKNLVDVADVQKKKRKKKKKSKKIEEGEEKEKPVGVIEPQEQVETIAPVEAAAVDTVEAEEVVNQEEAVKTPKLEETEKETDGVADNIVMRKLLRGPRYFDSPDCFLETCYNCDEVGHRAANCTAKKRKKPCFVCGSLEHGARNCKEGLECFICNKKGHRRKDCPEKDQRITKNCKICLRCGNLGHDMFFCTNDYTPEDLKEIKCYMCGKVGHLCCVDFVDTNPGEISCYNCGRAGHYGLGCASARGETSGTTSVTISATVCYKCGEEGHYARGCPQKWKLGHGVGESSTPAKPKKVLKEAKNKLGSHSAPHDLRKAHKKKSAQFEERGYTPAKKSKQRGGWIMDDPGDLSNRKVKVTNWRSPVTPPTRRNHVVPNVTTGGCTPNSHSWVKPRFNPVTPPSPYGSANGPSPYGSANGPSPYGSTNPYQYQRFPASRFGNGSSSSGGVGTPYQYHW